MMSYEDPNIAEVSPDGIYIRYHEILEEKKGKISYKGFDEDYGKDITWNKIQVGDSSEAIRLLQDSDQFLKQLKHKNIIQYYSSWMDHKTSDVNLICEAFTSGCLRKYRNKHNNVETCAIKKWARQILEGLCFLHTHDRPIVHGSLTCDNIFINGNTGEVKIGDPSLRNIVFGEEFSEDFDVYSFGICMLELATSQNPFSESNTLRDMYRKRTIPVALEKVKDEQFKKFIKKCLDSGSVKVSAKELLQDSFLQQTVQAPLVNDIEVRRIIGNNKFRLKAETTGKGLVLFKLGVDNLKGQKLEIEFEFDPETEKSIEVAGEMIDAFDLSSDDVILVAKLMDDLILRLVPCLKPSLLKFRYLMLPSVVSVY